VSTLESSEYNSACFYRQSNVDVRQLQKNLDNDTELAQKTLKAFIRASLVAIPTGKQKQYGCAESAVVRPIFTRPVGQPVITH
jgi:hypothetical protein